MIFGIMMILAGVAIAVFPQLLSIIVAVILILSGVFFLNLGYSYRKHARKFEDPFVDFFFRM